MTVVVGLLLTFLAGFVIGYPFWRSSVGKPGKGRSGGGGTGWSATDAMRKEIESDYRSGILTGEGYNELQAQRRPLTDETGGRTDEKPLMVGDEIEARVLQLRRTKRQNNKAPPVSLPDKGEELQEDVQRTRGTSSRTCPRCGAEYLEGDRFCGRCGTRLGAGGGR